MDERVHENRWIILCIVLIGPFMATLDGSIVNVALPNMASSLRVSIADIQWVVTSYLIVISSTILIFGRIADIKGKSFIYQNGFLIFSIGSLLCGIARSLGFLVFSRIVQAVGAAMIMSCNQGIITAIFPDNERGRALGLSGTTVALGTMLGPVVGGVLVSAFSWESIFLINVPIGVVAYILGAKLLPKEALHKNPIKDFDNKGAFIFSASIVVLFGSLLNTEKYGWGNAWVIIGFIAAIIGLILFYIWQKADDNPMVDLTLFHDKLFTVSILCAFISYMTIFFVNIIHPFYLQYVLQISPQRAGVLMAAYPVMVAIVAPISGYLADRVGGQILTILGLIITALGLVGLSRLNESSSIMSIIFRVGVLGVGNGLFQSPNNSIVMSSVAKAKLGIAGSINALVRNLGMVFGIAISLTILYNRMSFKMGYRVIDFQKGMGAVFIYAMSYVYIIGALICLIGVALSLMRNILSNKMLKNSK